MARADVEVVRLVGHRDTERPQDAPDRNVYGVERAGLAGPQTDPNLAIAARDNERVVFVPQPVREPCHVREQRRIYVTAEQISPMVR